MARRYWLMKSEPYVYSIDDLERDGSDGWEGVRNYQARNYMREMREGDLVLFYHSGTTTPGVAGVARVCREAYPDPTQHDPESEYFDPKSKPEEPRWSRVDVAFVEKFAREVPLSELKADPALASMPVTQRGSRLSVQPADEAHFRRVLKLAGAKTRV
ncbi:MAG: EVE domain-containing protein [Myxococcales bacterium]|nr:EVE domain-containing protein [Myxococcales bacterium]